MRTARIKEEGAACYEVVLTRHRARLTRKREIVLRAMAGGDWDGLQVLRHPRGAPIAVLQSS